MVIATGIGTGAGQYLAGNLTPDWRLPFVLVSVPAFFLVALYILTTENPKRGAAETVIRKIEQCKGEVVVSGSDNMITCGKFTSLFSQPSVVLIILQGLPGTLPWGYVINIIPYAYS